MDFLKKYIFLFRKIVPHTFYLLLPCLVVLGLFSLNKKKDFLKKTSIATKISPEKLPVITRRDKRKIKSKPSLVRNQETDLEHTSNKSALPAPLDHLSDEEETMFPGGYVVDSMEVSGPEEGESTRLRILKTGFKYPYIRTEEVVDQNSGGLVKREEMIANQVVVNLANIQDTQAFLKKYHSIAVSLDRITPDAPLYQLELATPSLEALPKALDAVSHEKVVAEPNFLGHISILPNDPGVQWFRKFAYWSEGVIPLMQGYGEEYQWGLFQIHAPQAWNVLNSAPSVVVAIIDSGILYTHEDLKGNMWHNPAPTNNDIYGWNAYEDNGNPVDQHGHGTFCAGIVGGVGNNDIGITGVAWKVQLMACCCTDAKGNMTDSDVITSLDYAVDHGANILNCSFSTPSYSDAIFDSISRAEQQGVIVVTAAGNDGKNLEQTAVYPSCYLLDNIITVTATDWNDELASFSNYGPWKVEVAAPGVNIYSTWGGKSASADITGVTGFGNSCYGIGQGSSASAPFATGALALMKMHFPYASYRLLIDKLLNSADKLPSLEGKVGYGRLNLAKALGVTDNQDNQNTETN